MPNSDLSERLAARNAASIAATPDDPLLERIRQVRAEYQEVRANRRAASEWAENADRILAEMERKLTRV